MFAITNMNKKRINIFAFAILLISLQLNSQSRYDVEVRRGSDELIMAWTGGANAPQFANIDFNGDDVKDLISFDRQGNVLRTYIRLPATGRWEQVWSYEAFFPKIVDWFQIVDFDKDGIEDLFTSASPAGIPGVTIYKGSFVNDIWSFTKLQDRGTDYLQVPAGQGLSNLYVSWDDIPSITDVDNDGDIDILSFEPGGTFISYYQNQSVEMGWGTDSLRFELVDFCWGKILENELTEEVYLSDNPDLCSDGNLTEEDPIRPRHSGSTVAILDIDFDGDKDAWLGDITSRHLVFLLNGLNAEEAWITSQSARFPSSDTMVEIPYFVAAYFVELDDDPEPEMLAAVNSRTLAEDRKSGWRYDDDTTGGPLNFKLTEKGWLQNEMIDLGSHSRPAVSDINGDGLKDLVIGGYHFTDGPATRIPSLWLFSNTGTLSQPSFKFITDDYLSMSLFGSNPTFDYAPAFGDLDGDGSIDLIVGDQNGKLFFYKNTSASGDSMIFATPVYPYMNIAVGVSATPQIADINGDGLNDLVVGERTGNADGNGRCSNLNYFQNQGIVGEPLFSPDVNAFPNTGCYGRVLFDIQIGLPQYSTPAIFRTEDGLVLMTGSEPGNLHVYGNLQAGIAGSLLELDTLYGGLDVGNRSAPAMADLNNDGKFEMIVGNQRGGLELFSTVFEVGSTSVADVEESIKPFTLLQDLGNKSVDIRWNDVPGESMLVDLFGRVLQTKSSSEIQQFDFQTYPSGVYFIRLQLKGNVWVEKIFIP